jgi:ABC-type multidrug transport system fused ATPase/permease subunit
VDIVRNTFTLIATLIAMFSLSPWLAVLAVAVVPTFYLPTRIVGGSATGSRGRRRSGTPSWSRSCRSG